MKLPVDPDATPPGDAQIEETIYGLLSARPPGRTICPSEVARALIEDEVGWRALMDEVRRVAQGLANAGRLRVTRGGVDVDVLKVGGAVRLGRPDGTD